MNARATAALSALLLLAGCLDDATTHACRITFAKRDGAWKLVGMPAADLRIEVPPPAAPKP